jgi:hypothetical protein
VVVVCGGADVVVAGETVVVVGGSVAGGAVVEADFGTDDDADGLAVVGGATVDVT